jgi:hypothetical protein
MDQGTDLTPMPGDPQMGKVYDSTVAYAALTKKTAQFQQMDPAGAALSNAEGRIPTFSAGTVAYSVYSTTPTDVLTISGSATKVIRVKRVGVSGRATGAGQLDVSLVKHTVANTGGGPVALTAVPHDTTVNPVATAVVNTYASAPSITGGTTFRAQQSNVSAAGSGGAATPVEWHFGDVNDQAVVLRGVAEQIAINLNGVAPAGSVLNIFLEWTEE